MRFFFLLLVSVLLTVPAFADDGVPDAVVQDEPSLDNQVSLVIPDPLPVEVVTPDPDYSLSSPASSDTYSLDDAIPDDPPSDPPFYGCCYIIGEDSSGRQYDLYFPVDYREDTWGVDSNGYIINIRSSSVSGYVDGFYNDSFSASGFGYPRVRYASSYDYEYLYLRPVSSNAQIATGFSGRMTISDLLPYVSILFLGVILLCCMKRSSI